jgi:hypothetical protein
MNKKSYAEVLIKGGTKQVVCQNPPLYSSSFHSVYTVKLHPPEPFFHLEFREFLTPSTFRRRLDVFLLQTAWPVGYTRKRMHYFWQTIEHRSDVQATPALNHGEADNEAEPGAPSTPRAGPYRGRFRNPSVSPSTSLENDSPVSTPTRSAKRRAVSKLNVLYAFPIFTKHRMISPKTKSGLSPRLLWRIILR